MLIHFVKEAPTSLEKKKINIFVTKNKFYTDTGT